MTADMLKLVVHLNSGKYYDSCCADCHCWIQRHGDGWM